MSYCVVVALYTTASHPTPNTPPACGTTVTTACLNNLGGGLFETGAGGSAPKHVEQFLKEVSVVQGVEYVVR
jgi:hypothetical protein